VGAQAVDDRLHRVFEGRADAVHLVDEADPRHAVAVGLAPDRFGLRLDARTASNTATAPSRTRSERSTSAVKSTWPGVSMMLILWPFHSTVVAADWMVMPRLRSSSR
jgi:hypothetical protein